MKIKNLLKYCRMLIFQYACNLQNSLVIWAICVDIFALYRQSEQMWVEYTCGKEVVEFMGGRRFLVDTSSDPHPLCIVRVLEVEGRS
jgi:hypothetical protein